MSNQQTPPPETLKNSLPIIAIIFSILLGEVILWGFTHGWFESGFMLINGMIGAILSILIFATGCIVGIWEWQR